MSKYMFESQLKNSTAAIPSSRVLEVEFETIWDNPTVVWNDEESHKAAFYKTSH